MRDQQPEIPVLHGCLGAEVVLEGPVDEVDGAGRRFAEQTAAQQQMAEDRRCVALLSGGGYGRQRLADDPLRPVPVEFRTAVADQPVGQPLEKLDLRLVAQLDARGARMSRSRSRRESSMPRAASYSSLRPVGR